MDDLKERIAELSDEILTLMRVERNIQREITEKILKLESLERSRETIAQHHPLTEYAESLKPREAVRS